MTNAASGPIARTTATSKNLALAAMLFAVSMTFIDQTIVAIASPNIQTELDLSRSGVQWVINGYILALAAGFALGGRLADVLGSKRVVLIGIIASPELPHCAASRRRVRSRRRGSSSSGSSRGFPRR